MKTSDYTQGYQDAAFERETHDPDNRPREYWRGYADAMREAYETDTGEYYA